MSLYEINGISPHLPEDEDFWIAPGAHVIGNVTIGTGVGIWFNVVIRGDNEPITIGNGSNIQENSVLHTDPGCPIAIGSNCTIGHRAMLHGCRLGDNTLIGMGATVLNGAVIGNNCLIGANALITEGKVIPDGSLVMGAPGKIIRSLDNDAIARLTASALHYQQNFRRFKTGLSVVSKL